MIVRTQIGTRESARQLHSEPSGGVTATNVQGAIDQLDARVTNNAAANTVRTVTDAGDVQVTDADGIVVVKKDVGAATIVNLDRAASFDHAVQVKDGKLDAAANNITITPHADDVNGIDGLPTLTINTNGGGFRLIPQTLGWAIG